MVSRGFTDFIEIIMLAAGSQAFLRRDGPRIVAFFIPEENVFELVHTSVNEQEGRIVRRQERRRMNGLMALLLKIIEKFLTDLASFHRRKIVTHYFRRPQVSREPCWYTGTLLVRWYTLTRWYTGTPWHAGTLVQRAGLNGLLFFELEGC